MNSMQREDETKMLNKQLTVYNYFNQLFFFSQLLVRMIVYVCVEIN